MVLAKASLAAAPYLLEAVSMETVLPSEFKRMMVLMLAGTPHVIEEFHTSGAAQTRPKLHARLRQLRTGHIVERVFTEHERVPVAHVDTRHLLFSYAQGDLRVFIDAENYEEFDLSVEQLGERRWFLKENEEYKALLLEGRLLDVVIPPQIPLKVADTAPPSHGGSDSAWKEARLETGLEIMVPLFIAKGETLRVDTATKKYAGREALAK
jgi:elongation factor P